MPWFLSWHSVWTVWLYKCCPIELVRHKWTWNEFFDTSHVLLMPAGCTWSKCNSKGSEYFSKWDRSAFWFYSKTKSAKLPHNLFTSDCRLTRKCQFYPRNCGAKTPNGCEYILNELYSIKPEKKERKKESTTQPVFRKLCLWAFKVLCLSMQVVVWKVTDSNDISERICNGANSCMASALQKHSGTQSGTCLLIDAAPLSICIMFVCVCVRVCSAPHSLCSCRTPHFPNIRRRM